MKTRHQSNKGLGSKSAQPQNPASKSRKPDKPDKLSPKVSLRDVTNHPFEADKNIKRTVRGSPRLQGAPLESQDLKKGPAEPTANQIAESKHAEGKQDKRTNLSYGTVSNPASAKGVGVLPKEEHVNEDGEKKDAGGNPEESEQDAKEKETLECATLEADKKTPELESTAGKAAVEETSSQESLTVSAPTTESTQAPQNAQRDSSDATAQVAPPSQLETDGNGDGNVSQRQTDGTATSSSSSTSKRTSGSRRVSFAHLRRTRAQRRAVAKARTERRECMRVEEMETERVRKLEEAGESERVRMMGVIESERMEREAARRREVRRVKNRESVEKSRVRELVLESEVENESGTLRRENDRMASGLEYLKREKVLQRVRKEVAALIRKRKRSNACE